MSGELRTPENLEAAANMRDGSNVRKMPANRGGQKPGDVPPVEARTSKSPFASSIEANAPEFKTPREYHQWLQGKVTRKEVIEDFDKLRQGIFSTVALAEATRAMHEGLLRYLTTRGIIDMQDYAKHAKAQLEFKEFLDALNSSPETPMREKADLCVSWNTDHPEIHVSGNYVRGLAKYLKENPEGLDLVTRAGYVSDLHMKEEQIFTEEELANLANALLEQAQTPVSVVSDELVPVQADAPVLVTKVDMDAMASVGKEPTDG